MSMAAQRSMILPILPPCHRRAQRIKHKLLHGLFAPIRGYTSAGQVQFYPRGLFRHSGNVLVFGDETRMNHLVENRHPAVDCGARHQYRCRSQDPEATSLVFMTRGERIARSSKFYPGALRLAYKPTRIVAIRWARI